MDLQESVAQVVAGLRVRSHLVVTQIIHRLATEFPGHPETLFCQGLQAWSGEHTAHAWRHWTELCAAHPASTFSVFPAMVMEELRRKVADRGELAHLLAFEKVLQSVEAGRPDWREAVEVAAGNADVEGLHQLARVCFRKGGLGLSLELAGRALKHRPNSVKALSEVGFYQLLLGQVEEAEEVGRRLAHEPKGLGAAAELLAGLGQDSEVLLLLGQAHRRPEERPDPTKAADPFRAASPCAGPAGLCHLAAVSSARLGRWSEAVELWTQALALDPQLKVAADNLRNAQLDLGERHSPWPFSLHHWIPTEEEGPRQRLLHVLLPILLDRGDPAAVVWALRVAVVDPEGNRDLLCRFATGTRGCDEWRALAVRILRGSDLLPDHFPYFSRGQWSRREMTQPLFSATTEGLLLSMTSREERPSPCRAKALR